MRAVLNGPCPNAAWQRQQQSSFMRCRLIRSIVPRELLYIGLGLSAPLQHWRIRTGAHRGYDLDEHPPVTHA